MNRYYRRTMLYGMTALMLILSACSASGNPPAPAATQTPAAKQAQASDDSASQGEKVVYIGIVNAPVTLNQINDQGTPLLTMRLR